MNKSTAKIMVNAAVVGTVSVFATGCIWRQLPPSHAQAGSAIREPSGAQPSSPNPWETGYNPGLRLQPVPKPGENWVRGIGTERVLQEPAGAQRPVAPSAPSQPVQQAPVAAPAPVQQAPAAPQPQPAPQAQPAPSTSLPPRSEVTRPAFTEPSGAQPSRSGNWLPGYNPGLRLQPEPRQGQNWVPAGSAPVMNEPSGAQAQPAPSAPTSQSFQSQPAFNEPSGAPASQPIVTRSGEWLPGYNPGVKKQAAQQQPNNHAPVKNAPAVIEPSGAQIQQTTPQNQNQNFDSGNHGQSQTPRSPLPSDQSDIEIQP